MKSQSRRNFLSSILVCAAFWTGGNDFFADESVPPSQKKAESWFSAQVLKLDLYAKTKAENAYIDYVIKLMNDKKISFKVVYASYKYAMKKKKGQRMFYFARVLPILSKKAGYKLQFPSLVDKQEST